MNSDDDYSDLTDLDSVDEYKPKKKSGPKTIKEGGYKIRNALKVPRATTYTAQALYDQIHSCDINLEPEYQRDVVWPETKQIGIIDSVFRNFYIPPVIFAVNTFEDGSETKTCIDGKQRLTSIHRFMDGFIPHKDPLTGERLWYKEVSSGNKPSRARKLLPERYRRLFANKQIVCVEYHDITDSDEREIFQRVQLGMALTPAEKLQVINTPRAGFVRELQAKYLKEEGALAGEALEWDRSRGGDFRCLAQAVYCMEYYGASLKNAGTIVKLEKWLSEDSEFPPSFRQKVQDAYKVFSELVLDKKLNKVFKNPAKISPIEFVMISLMVGVHKDHMSKAQLAGAIGDMRGDVRDTHVDIRMNDRVAKTMLDFIRNAKAKAVAGVVTGSGSESAGDKRKRTTATSDDDDAKQKGKRSSAPATPKPPPTAPRASSSTSMSESAPGASASGASASAPAGPSIPDRMAALRAAKLAAQNSSQNINRNPPPPSLQSQSPHTLQSNFSVTQLTSPGHTFTFPSSLNSPYQFSQLQPQSQPAPTPSPTTPLDMSLMAQMMRSNVTASTQPNLSINTSSMAVQPHSLPRPPAPPLDRDRDRGRPPPSSSYDTDRAPSRTNTRDEDYYSSRDRHRRSSGSGFGYNGRQDSGWGTGGR